MTVQTEENKVKKVSAKKRAITALSVAAAIVLLITAAFFIIIKNGESKLRGSAGNNSAGLPADDGAEIPENADAYYNGKAYNYNDRLINILLIGVDRVSPGSDEKHQADALYLVSLNTDTDSVNIIAISRNTVTDVDSYDINGEFFATSKQQICLAYSYGSDDKKRSENTAKAVSDFLYGIPVSGYYTIFMNSLEEIVDSVGGVPVTVTEDMTAVDPRFKKGASLTLTGDNALAYLRHRNDSNAPRLERQKAFISSFITQAKKACLKNLSLPVKMYDQLASNTVTDISASSAAYLATEAIGADFNMLSIAGESGNDGSYETFTADESALHKLLIENFYTEVTSAETED